MSQDQFYGSPHAKVVTGEIVPADDEATSSSPDPQQTYLHKVAGARAQADARDEVEAETEQGAEEQDEVVAADDSPTAPTAVTPDTVTPDAVTPDAVTPDAVTPDEVTPDEVTPDAERERRRAEEPAPAEPGPVSAVPQARRPGDQAVPPGTEGSLLADGPAIREQWMRIQGRFVDGPRAAVTEAADIVTDVTARIEAAMQERQRILRGRWDGNGRVDTETLRVLMQQYRALLERLAEL